MHLHSNLAILKFHETREDTFTRKQLEAPRIETTKKSSRTVYDWETICFTRVSTDRKVKINIHKPAIKKIKAQGTSALELELRIELYVLPRKGKI